MRRLAILLGGLVVVALLGAGIYYSVRAAYGGFRDYNYVKVDLPRAGQQLLIGSDVRVKGVEVGKVSDISLVDNHARLTLQLEPEYEIPAEASAVISLKTPLGAKYVDLRYEDASGPFLADGDTITQSHVGPELEDLLADGVKVFDAIDPDQAARVIGELATASRGHGDDVARGLRANNDLSLMFANTLEPQLRGLEDFRTIFRALESKGVDLNLIADAVNEGAPVYASRSAQRRLARALDALVPFADDLSDLLTYHKEDLDRLNDNGDKVLATIAARPGGLHDLVFGLYRYVFKLGHEIAPEYMVEDGSGGAGFTAFIGGNDQEEDVRQICTAFPPEVRGEIPVCEEGGS